MKGPLSKLGVKHSNPGANDGQWCADTNDAGILSSINPSTEKVIASIYCASKSDYETVVSSAQTAFADWRQWPAPKRGEIIRQIGDALREKKSWLAELITLENGKSLQEGLGEVQEMIDMADLAVGQSRMLYGKTMHSERVQHRMYEQWHPLGVIGVISAFNFPVAVWAWNAFLAAICGNTVVWKPSSKTPLCAIAVQNICNQVTQRNNLRGIFNLFITDNRDISDSLVHDPRIALISFTGSSKVGCYIYQHVAKRMGKCLLECSGNNAIIVDETANLEVAIPSIVFGAVGTAGQRCTATRRLFLHTSLYDKVVQQLISYYQTIRIGDPLDNKNLVGPLIDQQAVAEFQQAVASAVSLGGKVLVGGKPVARAGYFVEPTMISAENKWPIVQQETFSPILYVMRYQQFSEAISLQNSVSQGLSSALFTQNLQHAEYFLSALGSDCGIANVNIGTSGAEIGGAFGGEKTTGGGREAGSDSWQNYMRRQTNTINWSDKVLLAQGIQFSVKNK